MIVLVCCGRNFNDYYKMSSTLDMLPYEPSLIIEGGANGADKLARRWAIENGIHYAEVPALWDFFNNSAGNRRNSTMLKLRPEYCVAMPGGFGTKDMVHKCISKNIPVWEPYK